MSMPNPQHHNPQYAAQPPADNAAITYSVISPVLSPAPGMPPPGWRPGPGPGPGGAPGRSPVPMPPRSQPAVTRQVVQVLYAALGVFGVMLGVSLPGEHGSGWSTFTAWAVFAAMCAIVSLVGAVLNGAPWSWHLQAYATGGLVLFWLIAVRPVAITDVGFLATVGVAAPAIACLVDPARNQLFGGRGRPSFPVRR